MKGGVTPTNNKVIVNISIHSLPNLIFPLGQLTTSLYLSYLPIGKQLHPLSHHPSEPTHKGNTKLGSVLKKMQSRKQTDR
jgi:hypothetical protein